MTTSDADTAPPSRTVVVTGASSGIGATIARVFAARGDRVAIGARRPDRLKETEDAIREALRRSRNNKSETARLLGISRNGLAMKMRRYGIGGDVQ